MGKDSAHASTPSPFSPLVLSSATPTPTPTPIPILRRVSGCLHLPCPLADLPTPSYTDQLWQMPLVPLPLHITHRPLERRPKGRWTRQLTSQDGPCLAGAGAGAGRGAGRGYWPTGPMYNARPTHTSTGVSVSAPGFLVSIFNQLHCVCGGGWVWGEVGWRVEVVGV